MKVSQEAMSIYEQTHQLWRDNNVSPHHEVNNASRQKVDFNTATKAIKNFWKSEHPKRLFPYSSFKKTSGNRHTWEESHNHSTLKINTESGWANIVHDVSHLIWHRKRKRKPHHCADHAILERRFTRLILEKYLTKEIRHERN